MMESNRSDWTIRRVVFGASDSAPPDMTRDEHRHTKLARMVSKAIVKAGLPRPPHTWCLRMVQRAWDDVYLETSNIRELKKLMVERVLASAKLVYNLEGYYRFPDKIDKGQKR